MPLLNVCAGVDEMHGVASAREANIKEPSGFPKDLSPWRMILATRPSPRRHDSFRQSWYHDDVEFAAFAAMECRQHHFSPHAAISCKIQQRCVREWPLLPRCAA